MKKQDEVLITALLTKDASTAIEALNNGASPDILVRQRQTVESPEGVITHLCYDKVENTLAIARREHLKDVEDALLKMGVRTALGESQLHYNEQKDLNPTERLIASLLIKNENAALKALKDGADTQMIIYHCQAVETVEGSVKSLCSGAVETPRAMAVRMGMKKVLHQLDCDQQDKVKQTAAHHVQKHLAHQRQLAANIHTGWEMV